MPSFDQLVATSPGTHLSECNECAIKIDADVSTSWGCFQKSNSVKQVVPQHQLPDVCSTYATFSVSGSVSHMSISV